MIIVKYENKLTNEKGLTLVEILAAIVIIVIIFISIITILNLSAKSNRTSKEIIDATYIAQREMEFIYKLSTEDSSLSSKSGMYDLQGKDGDWNVYEKESDYDGFSIMVKEDNTNEPMVRIVVQVFEENDAGIKAQMETLLKWGEEHAENSP